MKSRCLDGHKLPGQGAYIAFLPQRPYFPLGTLRTALLYPYQEQEVSDETIREALTRCGLEHLISRIDETEQWSSLLSGGEQQRLAFARVLIHPPDILIMADPTSSLDELSQFRMMEYKHCCTTGTQRRITRWEHEQVLEAVQKRLDENPQAMRQRRETVEHPFGTLKMRMGATHLLMKRLPKVATEMALHVLAYNLTRVISIMGIQPLNPAIAGRILYAAAAVAVEHVHRLHDRLAPALIACSYTLSTFGT